MRYARRWIWVAPWGVAILALTLIPSDRGGAIGDPTCILCGAYGVADLILNLVLFAPLGWAMVRAGASPLAALLVGLGLSTSIEVLQLLLPGRSPTIRDVAINGFGAWCGAYLAVLARVWAYGTRWGGVRLLGSMLLVLAVVAATARLLGPARFSHDVLLVEWEPEYERRGNRWPGELLGVSVGDVRTPHGSLRVTEALRAAVEADGPWRLEALAADPALTYMPMLRVGLTFSENWLLVTQRGADLQLFPRKYAMDLRLRGPSHLFVNALEGMRAGDALRIEVTGLRGLTPCVQVNDRSPLCAPAPSIGRGWAMFVAPRRIPPWLLDLATLAVLMIPLGFFAASVPRRVALVATGLTLLAIPPVSTGIGLARVSPIEWGAIFAGLAVGWSLCTWERVRQLSAHSTLRADG